MKLSVAYSFQPDLLESLGKIPEVYEVYAKKDRDLIGGGRAAYTLRPVGWREIRAAVVKAHASGKEFNYLINGASLGGIEQSRSGQRALRQLLAQIDAMGVDAVTVASPHLLAIVKKEHPRLKVRISAFAVVDSARKAQEWEALGADTLCLSGIAVNRDRAQLTAIRKAVSCDLQLIVNASCLPGCSHELTHMQLLSQASRTRDKLGGFCLDYCFLNCAEKRLLDPTYYIKSIWIRPEDLHLYEEMGYTNFKILERSSPAELMLKRVHAYVARSFKGNLYELTAPVAQIKKEMKPSPWQYFRMLCTFAQPWIAKPKHLLAMKKFAENVIPHDFSAGTGPVYIDNKKLDGFCEALLARDCMHADCTKCSFCNGWAARCVTIKESWKEQAIAQARDLQQALADGSVWY